MIAKSLHPTVIADSLSPLLGRAQRSGASFAPKRSESVLIQFVTYMLSQMTHWKKLYAVFLDFLGVYLHLGGYTVSFTPVLWKLCSFNRDYRSHAKTGVIDCVHMLKRCVFYSHRPGKLILPRSFRNNARMIWANLAYSKLLHSCATFR